MVEYLDIADWFTESARVVEQVKSILLSVCFIAFFVWKSWTSRFLVLFGLYSFEIYLIHWPLISRYDVLFHTTPVWLATILSYMFLLGISILIQKTLHKII